MLHMGKLCTRQLRSHRRTPAPTPAAARSPHITGSDGSMQAFLSVPGRTPAVTPSGLSHHPTSGRPCRLRQVSTHVSSNGSVDPSAFSHTDASGTHAASPPIASTEIVLRSALQVTFDCPADDDCTVITVEGKDQSHLLMSLTSVFTSMGLDVVTASITSEYGRINDVFRVQTADGGQVPEDVFDDIRSKILSLTSSTNRSSRPAIYGVIAAAEIERLRPLASMGSASEVKTMELSAAEMALAASELVAREKELTQLREAESPDARLISIQESALAESAALLERRMTKMEQIIAMRRATASGKLPEQSVHTDSMDKVEAQACGSGYEILFQGFNWDSHAEAYYKNLTAKIPQLAAAGFTSIWMPPPSDAVSPQGYLPRDLYNLNSAYGTESELRDLISVMKEHNVKAIADIVVNHRCASKQGPKGHWNQFGGKLNWDATAICSDNPSFGGKGSRKRGDDYMAAPNIDHSQEFVRKDITAWMKWLKDSVGFDGWRYDFVRGYEGSYAKIYNDNTSPEMSFGEYWDCCNYTDGVLDYNQDSHRQQTIDWCDSTGGTSAAFDFTTKGILQEAVGRQEFWRLVDANGRPPGVLGMWASRAITFIDNHDTGSSLQHWPFPEDNLPEGYAYILTHPGTPTVFYDHFWEEKNGLSKAVKELVALRKKHGINCRSKVVIKKAINDVYAAIIDDKLAVKIGPGDWSPEREGVKLKGKAPKIASQGANFTIWETSK